MFDFACLSVVCCVGEFVGEGRKHGWVRSSVLMEAVSAALWLELDSSALGVCTVPVEDPSSVPRTNIGQLLQLLVTIVQEIRHPSLASTDTHIPDIYTQIYIHT